MPMADCPASRASCPRFPVTGAIDIAFVDRADIKQCARPQGHSATHASPHNVY